MGLPEEPSLHRVAMGRAVRDLRTRRGLTVRQLADQLGVSIGTVSAVENGRVATSTERAVQLADVLGVRPERLLQGVAEPIRDERWRVTAGEGEAAGAGHWRRFEPLDLDPALRELADAFSIATEYWDWQGSHGEVSAQTLVAVLAALGAISLGAKWP